MHREKSVGSVESPHAVISRVLLFVGLGASATIRCVPQISKPPGTSYHVVVLPWVLYYRWQLKVHYICYIIFTTVSPSYVEEGLFLSRRLLHQCRCSHRCIQTYQLSMEPRYWRYLEDFFGKGGTRPKVAIVKWNSEETLQHSLLDG
jgi:hypothetical protein